MVFLPRIRLAALDVSSRTGAVLGAFANGVSFQPNLLSRDSRGQALISGVAAASAFGWGSASHSVLRSVANRLPGARASVAGRLLSGLSVDVLAAVGGIAASRAVPARDDEPRARAVVRLVAGAVAATACAGVVADVLELRHGRLGGRTSLGAVAVTAWSLGFLLSRRGVMGAIALAGDTGGLVALAGGTDAGVVVAGGSSSSVALARETRRGHLSREVHVPVAVSAGLAVTAALLGLTWVESRLSAVAAGAAAATLGGEPEDNLALGRALVWATLGAAGWWALTRVNAMLTTASHAVERAHAARPTRPEVTGSPGSHIPWTDQSLEGRRWLTMTLTRERIEEVMGEPADQPIRLYAPLGAARTIQERAELLLAEIDRTQALRRPVFVLCTPTGSGYVNYVATETVELLTRGRCASASIQYSVLPSALSLARVGLGAVQTRIVLNGIVARLLDMPAHERPRFCMIGESLGAGVGMEPFAGQGIGAVDGVGLDAAIWLGTPAGNAWREQLWGGRPLGTPPAVGPGDAYLPRSIGDWLDLPAHERARVRFLFLDNGNDPVPKTAAPLLWRRPPWLGPDDQRPPGAPRHTWWIPVTTFFTTFLDLQNAMERTPGVFGEGGHDYRGVIPGAIRDVFRLEASESQMAAVGTALRRRELVWETRRRWLAALDRPSPSRERAMAEVTAAVSRWTGVYATQETVEALAASEV